MAALSATATTQYSAGSQSKHVFTFSSVSDADTFASGLSGVQDYSYQVTADPTTNTSAGANVSEASGTFTFYPGIDALSGILTVYSGGAA
jgi:hypothetical protein